MVFSDAFINIEDGISVSASPVLIEEKTSLWGYYLCVENCSNDVISLVGKDWNITDSLGNIFNDSTDGFKGEIPELEPGEVFEFTDVIPLNSKSGVFYGNCRIMKDGEFRNIKLPTFSMDNLNSSGLVN